MQRFNNIFTRNKCKIISMLHVNPLPGTPNYNGNFQSIIDKAKYEAHIYNKFNIDGVLIENMHDIPYIQNDKIGPEIVASMARVCTEVKHILRSEIACGIQVLACGNRQALAISKACDLQFIRSEGYIFSHIADEGFTNSDAGQLLRYRKQIDAENILIFTDIKKKHSSHSITNDVSILETAKTAEFFQSNGIILTGTATGQPINDMDLHSIYGNINIPILIGSGVNRENVSTIFRKSNGIIIGSHFKHNDNWQNELCEHKINSFMELVNELNHNEKK